MGYVLVAWKKPHGQKLPTDLTGANALLSERRMSPRRPSSRFVALGEALYERFAPSADRRTPTSNDAWADGSESGNTVEPVFTFELNDRSWHFDAAYQHAVVQARRLGLNLYDPQREEHHLVNGAQLPHGPVIDEATSARSWRMADWESALRDYRKAITKGSATALHDLGQCIRHGLGGLPVHIPLAAAMMQVAGAKDDTRRRQRLATQKLVEPELHELQASLRERLRASREMVAFVDRELNATVTERRRLDALPRVPANYSSDDWLSMRMQASFGDYWAAWRLANAFRPSAATLARPPWQLEDSAYQRCVLLAARLGSSYSQRRVAEGLLSGEGGWPLDAESALMWMKRALAGGEEVLSRPVDRLKRRLAQGWEAGPNRDLAEDLLHSARRRTGESRLNLLRRACELDHPEGWRQLGQAYLRGGDGLPKDRVVGAALVLAALKTFAESDVELGRDKPAELARIDAHDIGRALLLAHVLLADPDPWTTIARHREGLRDEHDFFDDEDDPVDTLASKIHPGVER
jgi:TPR repeat protein